MEEFGKDPVDVAMFFYQIELGGIPKGPIPPEAPLELTTFP